MDNLVSIIIPAYNAQRWIRCSIESALAQTWPRKELIIVDDGSADASLRIARSYSSASASVLTQEHRGASAARNRGLALAQGDYIQWLDADDVLSARKVSRQMRGADSGDRSRLLLSGPWAKFTYCLKRAKARPSGLWRDLTPVEWLVTKLNENCWMPPASWLVSRRLTDLGGQWNEALSLDDDGEYFCRVLAASAGVRFVDSAMAFKRTSLGGSLSHFSPDDGNKLRSQAASLECYVRTLLDLENSPRTRSACLTLLRRWVTRFHPDQGEIVSRMQDLARYAGGSLELPGGQRRTVSERVGGLTLTRWIRPASRRMRAMGGAIPELSCRIISQLRGRCAGRCHECASTEWGDRR